jgi:hypothetical protein
MTLPNDRDRLVQLGRGCELARRQIRRADDLLMKLEKERLARR